MSELNSIDLTDKPMPKRFAVDGKQARLAWSYLNSEYAVMKMKVASDLKRPAVMAVVRDIETIGPLRGFLASRRNKQVLGGWIKAVMDEAGYCLASSCPLKVRGRMQDDPRGPLENVPARGARYKRRK